MPEHQVNTLWSFISTTVFTAYKFVEWLFWLLFLVCVFWVDVITFFAFRFYERAKERRHAQLVLERQRQDGWSSGPPNLRDRSLD